MGSGQPEIAAMGPGRPVGEIVQALQAAPRNRKSRIAALDAVRAFACCTIVWNHSFNGNENLSFENSVLRHIAAAPAFLVGHTVLLFFVISGAVHFFFLKGRHGSQVQSGFLIRNFWRLYVPSVAALALSTALYYLSAATKGSGHIPSAWETFTNLTFTAHFADQNWTNVVLWNIAIQIQHVVWLGIVVIPLMRFRFGPMAAGIGLLAVSMITTLYMPSGREDILYHYPFFFLGYVLFELMVNRRHMLLIPGVLCLAWILHIFGTESAVLASIPFLLVLANGWSAFSHPAITWIARISFSLYLVHVPVGKRLINIGARWASNDLQACIVYVIAFAAMFASAMAFHKFVEMPATRRARQAFW